MTAYIFDVDGVISDPGEKRPTMEGILDIIADKLAKNEPVAFNTGRSLSWMIERVITPLLAKVVDKKSLQNFFAVGEKGGTWLTFDENGKIEEYKDASISVPLGLQQEIKELIESDFSTTTFFDDSKLTMISTEMIDGLSQEKREQLYRPDQQKLIHLLENILKNSNLENDFRIDPTTIATDIENKHVGKDFAIKRIVKWLRDIGIKPQKYIAFGDSKSDIPMAEELHKQGLSVDLVFVGDKPINPDDFPFPVVITKKHFEQGTLEYLTTRLR